MTRRQAVRVVLFERARLVGGGGTLRCAMVDLSAAGALLTLTARLPAPPLRLEFELGGEAFSLEVEVQRATLGEHVAVVFLDAPTDRLHRLIATEQRLALAAGRVNVRDRRSRRQPQSQPPPEPTSAPPSQEGLHVVGDSTVVGPED